ncbi:hypothetical protein GGX14DRAFT_644118 [Mycena pura]|uniref:Uncharacterized protein n=1 Tax=Mycena pura TaxID=153505 RepID=A0AAD6V8W3_9AGAR|nr:hypothetical protein GGX14DRAFT_644118 [Mycena pura]
MSPTPRDGFLRLLGLFCGAVILAEAVTAVHRQSAVRRQPAGNLNWDQPIRQLVPASIQVVASYSSPVPVLPARSLVRASNPHPLAPSLTLRWLTWGLVSPALPARLPLPALPVCFLVCPPVRPLVRPTPLVHALAHGPRSSVCSLAPRLSASSLASACLHIVASPCRHCSPSPTQASMQNSQIQAPTLSESLSPASRLAALPRTHHIPHAVAA